MPKLSASTRDLRRSRILDAARTCVDAHGLEAVSMEMIVAESGMSTGAVYRYFAGKDDIIRAAVLDGTSELLAALRPILTLDDPPPPAQFMAAVLRAVVDYGKGGAVDLTRVALHGWSHSRSDPLLQERMREAQRTLRDSYSAVARRWLSAGVLPDGVDPRAVAQLLLSITLGFVAQRTLAGNADIGAHTRALEALAQAQ